MSIVVKWLKYYFTEGAMKKYLVCTIIFSFLGFCAVAGAIGNISIGSNAGAVIGPIIFALVFIGLAVFNFISFLKTKTSYAEKATGQRVAFIPTVKTKGIWADDVHRLWQTRFTMFPKTYHYSDLKDFEIIRENTHTSTGGYQHSRGMFGSHGYSTRLTSTRMSYISLEIKLVNLQRLRWVPKLSYTDRHQIRADVEDTAELLEYIKKDNRQNNR